MIYNDSILKSYGSFPDAEGGMVVEKYKPKPSTEDFKTGFINRAFVKKINENTIVEIDYKNKSKLNKYLYKVVIVSWKISGPKIDVIKNGIVDKAGVVDQNRAEIDRIMKEEDVDLSSVLANLSEFWRGY